jgi:hypothetical protein
MCVCRLVQTEEIPFLSGSRKALFSPAVVEMNATMLLRFLQQNCSRESGTYLLHRAKGGGPVQLYDLQVLCLLVLLFVVLLGCGSRLQQLIRTVAVSKCSLLALSCYSDMLCGSGSHMVRKLFDRCSCSESTAIASLYAAVGLVSRSIAAAAESCTPLHC